MLIHSEGRLNTEEKLARILRKEDPALSAYEIFLVFNVFFKKFK